MTDVFRQLCTQVYRATEYEVSYDKCCPQYQRVLDYIHAHPEERDEIASAFGRLVRGAAGMRTEPDGLHCQIYLVQFLMESLKWPEIKTAAEEGFQNGGGPSWNEVKHLLEIYAAAS